MRRRATKVILFLLLGAIVNVAIAWGLACFYFDPPMHRWTVRDACRESKIPWERQTHWHVREFSKPGSSLVVVTMVALPNMTDYDFESLLPPDSAIHDRIDRFENQTPPATEFPGYFYWDGRGWPLISLAARWPWFDREWPAPSISGGLQLGAPTSTYPWPYGVHELRALPLIPIWPGFAINTIFYAAILWLPVAGLGALRRRRRIKRGLCPACAYPFPGVGTNAVCTECGKALKA